MAMMEETKSLISKQNTKDTEIITKDDQPRLGQWYWVPGIHRTYGKNDKTKEEKYEWLGCVMKIGSNFIELHSPHSDHHGYREERVHLDDLLSIRLEENPQQVIKENIDHWQHESRNLLNDIRNLVARLGLDPRHYLGCSIKNEESNSTALMVVSGHENIDTYKKELVLAKEKTLPDLFKAIKEANEELCRWMMAETMETQSLIEPMERSIKDVNDRIFAVSLYAGLVENVVRISDGDPAEITDKLHVMQRKLFMDEECLLNYQAGGMEFNDIKEFDQWMAIPKNRDRILPFPRTLVAMQIRRKTKERDSEGNLLRAFINIHLEQTDKFTFLYIRNGEQLYRLSCEMEFGKMIFPNKNAYNPSELKMVKLFGHHMDQTISIHEYEILVEKYNEQKINEEKWKEEHPKEHYFSNPYHHYTFNPEDWKPFDQTNLYFDECMEEIASQIREYNRIALIIQGLFDRSMVFHPHLPVKSWTSNGFDKAIKLVYDGDMTINYGEPPSFEAYRERCNSSLEEGSLVTGQEEYWMEREAEKENRRLYNDWRSKADCRHKLFQPFGDPGPGRVAKIAKWKKHSRVAIFTWERERRSWHSWKTDKLRETLTVPESRLFNISAYKPGDYLQFFNDPRTREQYLKWAPLLLTAEDYYAKHPKQKSRFNRNQAQ
jgi:hypothetical protein